LKAIVSRNVVASRAAIEKVVGLRIGALFVANPTISVYAAVLRFSEETVVSENQLVRAVKKLGAYENQILAVGHDFTKEARETAHQLRCDILSEREYGWTESILKSVKNSN
jgi:hypothetical protein